MDNGLFNGMPGDPSGRDDLFLRYQGWRLVSLRATPGYILLPFQGKDYLNLPFPQRSSVISLAKNLLRRAEIYRFSCTVAMDEGFRRCCFRYDAPTLDHP